MEKNQTNIDHLIKEKFDGFAPSPPGHIWNGIEKGIANRPAFFVQYGRYIAVAGIIIAILLLGIWYFTSRASVYNYGLRITDSLPARILNEIQKESLLAKMDKNTNVKNEIRQLQPENTHKQLAGATEKKNTAKATVLNQKQKTTKTEYTESQALSHQANDQFTANAAGETTQNPISFDDISKNTAGEDINTIPSVSLTINNKGPGKQVRFQEKPVSVMPYYKKPVNSSLWSVGLYLAPEMYFEHFDSLNILPSYTLSIEPTYYINDHFFIRFGLGYTYAHDRGFSQINFLSKDMIGTYEDVYDVTFDSVDGQLVPTYYTKTTEVWDTTQHMTVSEPTNTYFYLQAPLLFGYNNRSRYLNWYFYAGPSFSYMIDKKIENPTGEINYFEILGIKNNLPERSNYYVQLWLGAGIEVKASNHISIALEPNYRLKLGNLYQDQTHKKILSGFAIRFGLIYYIK